MTFIDLERRPTMKRVRNAGLGLIMSLLIAISIPVTSFAAPGSDYCCASGSNQVTGGYTYHGSSSHMYWANICYYTYDQEVAYRTCIICNKHTTCFGDKYNEHHSLH